MVRRFSSVPDCLAPTVRRGRFLLRTTEKSSTQPSCTAHPADLAQAIRVYSASDLYRNPQRPRSGWPSLAMRETDRQQYGRDSGSRFIVGCCVQKKSPEQKILLAMTIDSDTNKGGASRGTISRSCENAWNHSVYSAFERVFRLAFRRHGLPF